MPKDFQALPVVDISGLSSSDPAARQACADAAAAAHVAPGWWTPICTP